METRAEFVFAEMLKSCELVTSRPAPAGVKAMVYWPALRIEMLEKVAVPSTVLFVCTVGPKMVALGSTEAEMV